MFGKSFKLSTLATAGLLASSSILVAAQASDANPPKFDYGKVSGTYPGVQGTNKNGKTNPKAPSLNTPINQQSDSRLASVNSVDDWCTFGPAGTGQNIGDIEAETVAWCTKPRNNARVIPDGTLTAVHFVKTDLYVQIMALGDFTKIGLVEGDDGGELDPHGATNMGNPVGGNVTSNVSGQDVFYEEWMNFISYNQVCIRICTAAGKKVSTASECEHKLDVMGCNFVMPGDYTDNVFESCDGDAAYPPGLFPQPDGSTSTFQQYYVGSYDGTTYTIGSSDQVTPTAAYSIPSVSNCKSVDSIANGIASLAQTSSSAAPTTTTGVVTIVQSGTTRTSATTRTMHASSSSTAGAMRQAAMMNPAGGSFVGTAVLGMLVMSAVLAGAVAVL